MCVFQCASAENSLVDIKDKLSNIYYSFDASAYRKLINEIANFKPAENEKFYIKYYNSIAMLNLGKINYQTNKSKAKSLFLIAEKECTSAIELSPKAKLSKSSLAELYAIYCDILSKKASLETVMAFSTGQKAHRAIEKAAALDKQNVIVRLIGAIQLMHLPEILGGDKAKSRELLNSVLKLQSHRSEDPLFITIAENAEVYAYLAQLEILERNIPAAESYIKKAIALEPNYGYVMQDLRKQINILED
jgi:hypothetical protein